ncbi:uncharacterized protein LOC144070868 isoform X2 [Stigmatopora argus]
MEAAFRKFPGGDNEWSCVGERILDFLLEMKKTKEEKGKFCWEIKQLNAGCQGNDVPAVPEAAVRKCSHQSAKKKTEAEVAMRRLLKAARQSWARLMTEGVQNLVGSPGTVPRQGVRIESWGHVTPSDVLLLNQAKYEAVARSLFADMLRDHHGAHVWETLRPLQRHSETLWLEELAEDALASDDMVALADLPGAFFVYRKECFSAVSLLYKLNACRQQEMEDLSALVERLDKKNLRLTCLHIQSAMLAAERETLVYNAYLAVRQSWDAWPHVPSPCREELAAALLNGEDEAQEQIGELDSLSARQAIFQLLLLTQLQERNQLMRLLREVTLEEVQTQTTAAASKTSCIKKLRQMCENQTRRNTSGPPTEWSQAQLERAVSALVVHLLEFQDGERSSVLSALSADEEEHLPALKREYQSKWQKLKLNTHLIRVLDPDGASTNSKSDSGSQSPVAQQSTYAQPAPVENLAVGLRQSSTAAPLRGVRTGGLPDKRGVCAGCGVTLGGLPCLEVLCAPDEMTGVDGEVAKADDEKKRPGWEEQDSLISLAWSNQLEVTRGEAANEVNVQLRTGETSVVQRKDSKGEAEKANILHTDLACPQQALADSVETKTSDQDVLTDLGPHAVSTTRCRARGKKAGTEYGEPLSAIEREQTMRKLVDVHRRVERRQRWDRERQQLRVQERLSIIRSKKANEDLFGPEHRDRMRRLSKDRAQEDKTSVREQLEQLRRERSFIMQSRRKRNVAGFKELLIPVNLQSGRREDGDEQENGTQ